MSLFDKLSKISEQVKAQRDRMTNEAVTRSVSIRPFLRVLGHDADDSRQVFEEFDADPKWAGGRKVDFAILNNDEPYILLEAKPASGNLGAKNWEQLYHYFNATESRYGILTNGLIYEFYSDRDKTNIMDRQPFLTIDLLNLDARRITDLEPIMRASFPNEYGNEDSASEPNPELDNFEYPIHGVFKGRRHEGTLVVDRVMNWHKQLILVRFKGELMAHTAAQIKALWSADANLKSSIAAWTFWRFIHPLSGEDLPISEICLDVQRKGELRKQLWESVRSVQTDGDAIPVFGCRAGHRFEAELLRDYLKNKLWGNSNCIVYQGQQMHAGAAARQAIAAADSSFSGDINGLDFWRVIDPKDQSERKLTDISGHIEDSDDGLRQRLLDAYA